MIFYDYFEISHDTEKNSAQSKRERKRRKCCVVKMLRVQSIKFIFICMHTHTHIFFAMFLNANTRRREAKFEAKCGRDRAE